MRHTRTRRRFKFIISLLLAACIILFFESRIEAFVPQLKNFAEIEIGQTFGSNAKLSIGNIDGGIVRPLVLNDVAIRNDKDLVINSIRTNYRIWDLLFKRVGKSCVYIDFAVRNKEISGLVKVEGSFFDSNVKGYINLYKNRFDFDGRIKENSFDIELRPSSGTLRAKGKISDDGTLTVNFKINHLKFYGYDIVCEANSKNGITADHLDGEFETHNTILDYKPFLDFKASYKIFRGVAEIIDLKGGDIFKVYGKVFLKKPHNIALTLLVNNMNLNWFMTSLGAPGASSIISGTMNAKFDLKGPVEKLKLNAHMEIRKGTISELDFDTLTASLKGDLPFIRIEDSRITRESGYFVLAGEMDLRKFGKAGLFSNIKIASDDKAITWDNWNTSRAQNVQEVKMTKKLNEDVNLDFKKYIAEEKIDESIRDKDEVGFEYKLHPNDSLKMSVGQDKEFFGFEHKDKF